MIDIDKNSFFWEYLSSGQRGLIEEGLYLLEKAKDDKDAQISDYSYLVFPFAKAYEGFLKKLFLDLRFITQKEYKSNHFRIGKALNPYLEKRFRHRSVYDKIAHYCSGEQLADDLWLVWKKGRNLVFHYFPNNLRALSLPEAEEIIVAILSIMKEAVKGCRVEKTIL